MMVQKTRWQEQVLAAEAEGWDCLPGAGPSPGDGTTYIQDEFSLQLNLPRNALPDMPSAWVAKLVAKMNHGSFCLAEMAAPATLPGLIHFDGG